MSAFKNNLFIFLISSSISFTACTDEAVTISAYNETEVIITPDYKDVTIPYNIAPLNFSVEEPTDNMALLIEGGDRTLTVPAKDGLFDIPMKAWKSLLAESTGKDLTFTICERQGGAWTAYKPFAMHVAEEPVDKYLAYRLIQPCYTEWFQMGIYQRDLESYEQTAIYENRLTDYNCVNCHSFHAGNSERMLFHMRAKSAGTVLLEEGNIQKLNTKTDDTMSALVYPYWHPSGDYVAASVNETLQSFFAHQTSPIEVYDVASDVVIYDVRRQEIFSSPLLRSEDTFETFPTFSPDGKSLYFCSAKAVTGLPVNYKEVKYSLCRIDIDVETRTFGTKVDTLFNAETEGRSVSFPRISPDGRYMAVTVHGAGTFPIWHSDADLYLIDLLDGTMSAMEQANSPTETDSYHSWSSNGRWMAFSSRRMDGGYTRPYFTYIDKQGKAHKPFLLPQKDPKKYYADLFFSYNIPELVKDKVKVNPQDIARVMRETEGITLSYKK